MKRLAFALLGKDAMAPTRNWPTARLALGVALALSMSLRMGTAAARPDTGGRDIQDFATADFRQTLNACLRADASVRLIAGDNLQSPIGSGRPGSWSDTDIHLDLINTCIEHEQMVLSMDCFTTVAEPDIDRLERAALHVGGYLCSIEDVSAAANLEWIGNDDATVRIDHQLGTGYFRQERFETASVSGTLVIDPIPGWTDEIAFTADDLTGATIGTANEISLP